MSHSTWANARKMCSFVSSAWSRRRDSSTARSTIALRRFRRSCSGRMSKSSTCTASCLAGFSKTTGHSGARDAAPCAQAMVGCSSCGIDRADVVAARSGRARATRSRSRAANRAVRLPTRSVPSRAAMRCSVGGCVLKRDIRPPTENGLMMNMCAVAGLASSGTRLRRRLDLPQRADQAHAGCRRSPRRRRRRRTRATAKSPSESASRRSAPG